MQTTFLYKLAPFYFQQHTPLFSHKLRLTRPYSRPIFRYSHNLFFGGCSCNT